MDKKSYQEYFLSIKKDKLNQEESNELIDKLISFNNVSLLND